MEQTQNNSTVAQRIAAIETNLLRHSLAVAAVKNDPTGPLAVSACCSNTLSNAVSHSRQTTIHSAWLSRDNSVESSESFRSDVPQ
jgi:hypothetical protein